MADTRDKFMFYGSFFDAISGLDDETRLVVYDAVCSYALTGAEPELTGVPRAIFLLIKPQIDANNKRFDNGKKGGAPKQEATEHEPDDNQSITKPEPNPNQDVTGSEPNKKEKEKENKKEKDIRALCADVIEYLNKKASTAFKPNTPKTVQLITAREREGFTLADFKTVIDKKCSEWKTNGDMCKFLRPETLFGTKFEGYLNQLKHSGSGFRPESMEDRKAFPQHEYTEEERQAERIKAVRELLDTTNEDIEREKREAMREILRDCGDE